MITKFISRITIFVMLSLIAVPGISSSLDSAQATIPAKMENNRGQQLMSRLEEIKALDKSSLTRLEKKALRTEVKDIRKEMKTANNGIYLSIGAIIIIILLLILLL